MRHRLHALYIVFLVVIGSVLALGPAIHGGSYYLTPLKDRPFHPLHESLRPTGLAGHGYGIVGSSMIVLGVAVYSTRKRVRRFASVGKLKHFLEFHILLCLTGPILILYHTTFKFGGLVTIGFWSMTAVLTSGLIGRYLYAQIPRGIQGQEVDLAQLTSWHGQLADHLRDEFGLTTRVMQKIDAIAATPKPPAEMSLGQVLRYIIAGDLTRNSRLRSVASDLHAAVTRTKCHGSRCAAAGSPRRAILRFGRYPDCHADPHGGQFVSRTDGGECSSCHNERGWEGSVPSGFDHAATYNNFDLLVVGGGDSAVEAAIALSLQNSTRVTLSYRGAEFKRVKARNLSRLEETVRCKRISLLLESTVREIREDVVFLDSGRGPIELPNRYVFVLAGGDLPFEFLQRVGIRFQNQAVTDSPPPFP
jgi:hypothetical protein